MVHWCFFQVEDCSYRHLGVSRRSLTWHRPVGGLTPLSTLQSIPRNAPERIAVLDTDLVVFYLGNGFGFGEILNQDSGGLETPTVSPAVPSPASGSFQQPLEAMKEKEVHPKQVKVMGGGSRARCADGLHLWPTLRHWPPSVA